MFDAKFPRWIFRKSVLNYEIIYVGFSYFQKSYSQILKLITLNFHIFFNCSVDVFKTLNFNLLTKILMSQLDLKWKHNYFVLGLGLASEAALSIILACAYQCPTNTCFELVKFGKQHYMEKYGDLAVVRENRYARFTSLNLTIGASIKLYCQINHEKKRPWIRLSIYPCSQPKRSFEVFNFGSNKPTCFVEVGSGEDLPSNLYSLCESIKEQFNLEMI